MTAASLRTGAPPAEHVERRQGRGVARRLRPGLDLAIAMIATIVLWQLVAISGAFGSTIPPVLDALGALVTVLGEPVTYFAIWSTLWGWFVGLAIAIVIAVPTGMVVGSTKFLSHSLRLTVDFLRTVPPVVYIPLLLLTFGASPLLKVTLIVLGAVWPLFIQSMYAVREVDPIALDSARAMRLSRALRIRAVLIPSALPFLFTGLRVAAAFCLLFALAAELLGGSPGIGRQIALAQLASDPTRAFAYLLLSGALGIGINAVMTSIQRRALPWHPSSRKRRA